MSKLVFILLLYFVESAGAAEHGFVELVIDAGFHVEQPVLAASLDGQNRHIVLAGRDDDHGQYLAVYAVSDGSSPSGELVLQLHPTANLIAFDVGQLDDKDALYFIEPGRILRYDFAAGELVEQLEISTIYGQERTGDIVPVDFFRDVNEDGRDDLVVPDTAGYRVRLQREDGTLSDEALLDESSRMTITGGIVSFESRPLFSGDMNLDGLIDLGVWRGDSLRVYPQLPGDRIQGEPLVVPLGLDLLSEAEQRRLQSGPGAADRNGLVERSIWSIEDRNNDRLPDVLIESAVSEGVFNRRNDLGLHLGLGDGDEVAYNELPDNLLESEGLQYGLVTKDFDGDGNKDLLVRKVRVSFARVIRALLSGNVSLQLHFYKMTDGRYPQKPNYVTKTNVRFSVSSGHIDIPAIQSADFDGDGRKDLMMQTKATRLEFYSGIPGEELFDDDSVTVEVTLPRNGDLVEAEDIDGDGKSDLIIRYSVTDTPGMSQTVRLLFAGD